MTRLDERSQQKRKQLKIWKKRNELIQILMGSKQSGGVTKYSALPQSVGQGDRYKTYQSDGRLGGALIHGQQASIVIGGMGTISWIKKDFVQVINALLLSYSLLLSLTISYSLLLSYSLTLLLSLTQSSLTFSLSLSLSLCMCVGVCLCVCR